MELIVKVPLTLKGIGVKLGIKQANGNERTIGVNAEQTVLQQDDIDAAKRQIDITKHKIGDAWDKAQKNMKEAKQKLADAKALKAQAKADDAAAAAT